MVAALMERVWSAIHASRLVRSAATHTSCRGTVGMDWDVLAAEESVAYARHIGACTWPCASVQQQPRLPPPFACAAPAPAPP